MISSVVIDTNVLVAANENSEQAGPNCVLACVSALENAKAHKMILVDSGMRIFEEYRRHANHSGRPGLGDAFFKWLWNNQANLSHCEQVDITPKTHDLHDFEEFPDDPKLAGFHRSDRKFVAVYLMRPIPIGGISESLWQRTDCKLSSYVLVCFGELTNHFTASLLFITQDKKIYK